MKKFILFVLLPLVLSGCSLPFLSSGQNAALRITTTPKAAVFLDGENIGSSPYYDENLKPGEYTLRLVPEGGEGQPWETRVTLYSGIYTVISRELGESPDRSSGYVLSLDPGSNSQEAGLLVVTVPDGAVVTVDSEPRGFSPVSISNLTEGEHNLVVSSPGYFDKSVKTILVNGYKLTANVQLAKSNQVVDRNSERDGDEQNTGDSNDTRDDELAEEDDVIDSNIQADDIEVDDTKEDDAEPTPRSTTSKKSDDTLNPPYVTIKDTDTGWLNVREKPTTAEDNIMTKVDPGDQFEFIESNDTGWYQIRLDDGKEGWISGKYATLTKEE